MILWLVLLIALIILELSTTQLICIWFAGGALAALIVSLFTDSFILQALAFLVVSGILLVSTKKIVRKLKKSPELKTNSQALIGMSGVVTENISNIDSTGAIKVNGLEWSARSTDNVIKIPIGSYVKVKEIDGVKVIVEIIKEETKCY